MCGLDFGIELNVVAAAAPNVTHIAEEVVNLINIAFHGAKLIDRYIDIGMLFAMGIKIDNDKNDAVARRRDFAIKQDRVIISVIETQVIVKIESAILGQNVILPRYTVLDVLRHVQIMFVQL